MNYGEIKKFDIANGIGVRVSLFVSGCRHRCKGCFNEETWDFSFGEKYTEETKKQIIEYLKPDYISGLSILGGEPFEPENQKDLAELVSMVKKTYPSKSIWCYTGFCFEDEILFVSRAKTEYTETLLKNIDVLVDGKFIEDQKDISLKFRGSKNQRIIDVKESLNSGKTVIYEV